MFVAGSGRIIVSWDVDSLYILWRTRLLLIIMGYVDGFDHNGIFNICLHGVLLLFLRKYVVADLWMSVVTLFWWLEYILIVNLMILTGSLIYDHWFLVILLLYLLEFLVGVALLLVLLFIFIVLTFGQVLPN